MIARPSGPTSGAAPKRVQKSICAPADYSINSLLSRAAFGGAGELEPGYIKMLQVSSPMAAMLAIAARGLVTNCQARISGTERLMLENGSSLSIPQRAIM